MIVAERRDNLTDHLKHEGVFLNTIIEGWISEKRFSGRPQLRYMGQIIKDVVCKTNGEMKKKKEIREEWRYAAN